MTMVHQTHVLVGAGRCSVQTRRVTLRAMLRIVALTIQTTAWAKRMRTRMQMKIQRNTSLMLWLTIRGSTKAICASANESVYRGWSRTTCGYSSTGTTWPWSGRRYLNASQIGPQAQYGRAIICCKGNDPSLRQHRYMYPIPLGDAAHIVLYHMAIARPRCIRPASTSFGAGFGAARFSQVLGRFVARCGLDVKG